MYIRVPVTECWRACVTRIGVIPDGILLANPLVTSQRLRRFAERLRVVAGWAAAQPATTRKKRASRSGEESEKQVRQQDLILPD